MDGAKMWKLLEKYTIDELDEIIDELEIWTTENYEDESKGEKIGMILGEVKSEDELRKVVVNAGVKWR